VAEGNGSKVTSPRKPSICFECEYYTPGTDPENPLGIPVCRAFPEGIPSKIIDGGYDHRQPLGTETILFKEREGGSVKDWEKAIAEIDKEDVMGLFDSFQEGPEDEEA
jgi:hypothetical protein